MGNRADRGTFRKFQASIDPRWIEEALAASGTATLRRRRLPAEQVIWLVLGMALFRDLSIASVVATLDLALPGVGGREVLSGTIAQARARLGSAPMAWLFSRTAENWTKKSAEKHLWRGYSLYAVDGTSLRVPDSKANRETFGSANGARGTSGYPLVRLVTLMAVRSHLLLAARLGPYTRSENSYAKELWDAVPDDSVLLVDRAYINAATLIPIAAGSRNRHWLTRSKSSTKWKHLRNLGDGDDLVEMNVNSERRREDPSLPKRWEVRAIRYQKAGYEPQTLLTSMLDPIRFPAKEIVGLYHERWEIELGFDELKTDLLKREEAIRSQTPTGVEQELWGILIAYNLVRLEMEHIAEEVGVLPTRISFIGAYRHIKTTLVLATYVSPGAIPKFLAKQRAAYVSMVLPPRRSERVFPRVVKLKMTRYAKKQTLN